MKLKALLILLILISPIFAVENFGYYNGKFSIKAENYVLQLPQNLAEKSILNNQYGINLFPSIKINNNAVTIAPSIQQTLISKPKSIFSFKVASEKNGIEIEEKIKIEEKKITSEVFIKNLNDEKAKISIYAPLSMEEEKTIFIANNYKNNSNYLVLTNKNFNGNSLGISFSTEMDLKNQKQVLINTSNYGISSKEVILKKGQGYSIKIIYYPFNLQEKRKTSYPLSESSYLENTYIKTIGKKPLIKTNSSDKISQILGELNSLKKTSNGEFLEEHNVNLNNLKDSLDYSMYFKEEANEKNVPTRLIIGKKGENEYAWVSVYFGKWRDIDVFKGVREKPEVDKIIFSEPRLELHLLKNKTNKIQDIYEASAWLKKTQQNNFLIYLIFLIITGGLVAIFINLKSGIIEKKFKKTKIEKQELNGKYNILKKEKLKEEFINEIFEKIINNNGEVNLSKIADEFHYSKELVSFAVAYLIDKGFMKKEGVITEKKKGFTLKQKIAVGVISICSIILIIYLLVK